MITEIIIATGNKHKVEEISAILKDFNIKVIPMTSFPSYPKTAEDGKTLEENAVKKAKEAALYFKKWALADDTGLEVDYLNGEPGVYSARYAGDGCSYDDNNKKLLAALKDAPSGKRNAQFRCVIAVSSPEGEVSLAEGKIFGIILGHSAGDKGFGYDPVFFVPEQNKTFAELDAEVKNKISHRAQALQKAKEIIRQVKSNK
ncbi:MAG: XTP/dITP diphosphatase [Endomicrobia bacterium]|nr:XTP/dITP diphosphatase [Endomicrobiia bacterium]